MKVFPQKKGLDLVIGIILIKLLLDFAYSEIVSYIFDYQNYLNNPTIISVTISWIMLITLFPLIIKNFNLSTISANIISILLLISFLPTCTMIQFHSNYDFKYILLMYLYWLLLLWINLKFPVLTFELNRYFKSKYFYAPLIIILCVSILYISWIYTGFRVHFGLIDVYEIRTESRQYEVSTIIGYLVTAADNILPIVLVYFLTNKKWTFSIIISVIIFLNFGISAVKQVLFLLFFAYIGYFFVNTNRLAKYFIWGILALTSFSIIEYYLVGTYALTNFGLYRIFFIPSKLHYVYYSFFSNNELDYFRQSALKFFLDSPYKDNIQFLMGDYDIGDFTARANNGLFTDAYLNFGIIGVLVFPIILIFILRLLDASSKNMNPKVNFITITVVTFLILGIPFTTVLLSSGLFLLIILLKSLPRHFTLKNYE